MYIVYVLLICSVVYVQYIMVLGIDMDLWNQQYNYYIPLINSKNK